MNSLNGELSIKVSIANREYPLRIKFEEEENIRKATKLINDRIKNYEENYSVKDKQDLLAMCVLQFATETLNKDSRPSDYQLVKDKIFEIDSLISDFLSKA